MNIQNLSDTDMLHLILLVAVGAGGDDLKTAFPADQLLVMRSAFAMMGAEERGEVLVSMSTGLNNLQESIQKINLIK